MKEYYLAGFPLFLHKKKKKKKKQLAKILYK